MVAGTSNGESQVRDWLCLVLVYLRPMVDVGNTEVSLSQTNVRVRISGSANCSEELIVSVRGACKILFRKLVVMVVAEG